MSDIKAYVNGQEYKPRKVIRDTDTNTGAKISIETTGELLKNRQHHSQMAGYINTRISADRQIGQRVVEAIDDVILVTSKNKWDMYYGIDKEQEIFDYIRKNCPYN